MIPQTRQTDGEITARRRRGTELIARARDWRILAVGIDPLPSGLRGGAGVTVSGQTDNGGPVPSGTLGSDRRNKGSAMQDEANKPQSTAEPATGRRPWTTPLVVLGEAVDETSKPFYAVEIGSGTSAQGPSS